MINKLVEDALAQEALEFPIHRFLRSDGSVNTTRIKKLNKDFQQEALNLIFIIRAIGYHGRRYGYSEVNYTTANQLVTIICEEHGEFKQTAKVHLAGSGCPQCGKRGVLHD